MLSFYIIYLSVVKLQTLKPKLIKPWMANSLPTPIFLYPQHPQITCQKLVTKLPTFSNAVFHSKTVIFGSIQNWEKQEKCNLSPVTSMIYAPKPFEGQSGKRIAHTCSVVYPNCEEIVLFLSLTPAVSLLYLDYVLANL